MAGLIEAYNHTIGEKANDVDAFAEAYLAIMGAKLDDEEIDYYVENYLPLDKAGAYGIQDWIGNVAVERIEGSYFNVVGLPMQRLYNALKAF